MRNCTCKLCHLLSDPVRKSVLSTGGEINLSLGTVLFHEDEPSEGFFVVQSGSIEMLRSTASGKEVALLVAKPGDLIGAASLFGRKVNLGTAIAREKSSLLFFARDRIIPVLYSSPEASFALMDLICEKTFRLSHAMMKTALLDARLKVAYYLLSIANDPKSVAWVQLHERKKAIATHLNLKPETFSRALKSLQAESLIQMQGDRILIDSKKILERFKDLQHLQNDENFN